MATYQHGRGKQSFRDYNRSLKDEMKDILNAIKEGEQYSANDVVRILTSVTNEYIQRLRGEELDVEMWGDRAIDKQVEVQEAIITKFELDEQEEREEEDNSGEVENEEFNPDDTEAEGTLFGFPLVTKENKAEVRSKSKPRGRIFDTLTDLGEYVQKVPYVTYIQILTGYNNRKSYRVWVDASKEKKKKRR